MGLCLYGELVKNITMIDIKYSENIGFSKGMALYLDNSKNIEDTTIFLKNIEI